MQRRSRRDAVGQAWCPNPRPASEQSCPSARAASPLQGMDAEQALAVAFFLTNHITSRGSKNSEDVSPFAHHFLVSDPIP